MLNEIKMGVNYSLVRVRHLHTSEPAVNNEDPDDGNSWSCSACTLPIFLTPFESRDELLVHDDCANLPQELTAHTFHRNGRLVLKANKDSSSCSQCHKECGSMMYECPDSYCGFKLDLLCALQITILHRSHHHRLMAITGSNSFKCGACETQHPGFSDLFYLCKGCNFWIHADCASLPNAITTLHHQHSLYLTYNLRTPSRNPESESRTCAICESVEESKGVYFCAECDYYAHIKCAISDARSFKPVLIRDAKLAGLCHLPMADEHSSLMPYIMESTSNDHGVNQSEGKFFREYLHQHPLMFQDEDEDSDDQSGRICNACAQLISCEAFYRCSECPDFFLHKCCVNLPTQIQHPSHKHPLTLFPKAPNSSISGCFLCQSCRKWCNRFAYSCSTCPYSCIDVVCAMMPPLITHHLHGKSHILFSQNHFISNFEQPRSSEFTLRSGYTCSTCRDFLIDSWSTQLPSSTKHKFDEHPLKLTASDGYSVTGLRICEICEDDIPSYLDSIASFNWYYSCSQCEQSFHCDCIHGFSNFKLGGTIRVNCHDCPLTLIPETTVYGYRCNYCQKVFTSGGIENQKPAYECSECYFRIHDDCAGKCLVNGE